MTNTADLTQTADATDIADAEAPTASAEAASVSETADTEATSVSAAAPAEAPPASAVAPVEAAAASAVVPTEAAAAGGEGADGAGPSVITEDDLLFGAEEEAPTPVSPYDRPGRWFVVHTQSGYENKVKQNLEARTASMNMEDRIHEVVIPVRDEPEFKGGKKVISSKKLFPGYLLVRCDNDDEAWQVIRNTPGVTGFVNQNGKPSPLRRRDVETFLGLEADRSQEASKRLKPIFQFGMGETVRVKEGPFADFSGQIIEINEDQLKVKVLVNIFGRETPVELEFAQVARL